MILQIGMRVKIKDNAECGNSNGKVKVITADLPKFNNKRAFQLDDEKASIYLIEDFEQCIDYPNLSME